MKNLFNLVFLLSVLIVNGCAEDNWTEQEKNDFVKNCVAEGGTKLYCKCFMEKAMNKFPIAEDADDMEFEEAVELSKDCK